MAASLRLEYFFINLPLKSSQDQNRQQFLINPILQSQIKIYFQFSAY